MNGNQTPSIITRWKWTLTTLDQTERYLSQMCAAGWGPVSVTGTSLFTFAPTEPGEYVCASAATVKSSGLFSGSFDRAKYAELAALLKAQGAYVVPQGAIWGAQEGIIAVRQADQGPLVINSTTDSRIDDLRARYRYHMAQSSSSAVLAVIFWWLLGAAGIAFFGVAAAYGWSAHKYSREVKRLERDREVFE